MNKVAYKSVDELEHFRFDDCQIDTFAVTENGVELMVEALIVRADNSQNTNYTESYAGTTKIRITDGKLIRCVRDGYKYYDANDVLVETVPDRPVDESRYDEVMKSFEGKVIFFAATPREKSSERKCFQMIIDVEEESYVLSFYYDKVIAQWEHFMNKVMN